MQFHDLVNVRLARSGPVWAQRGGADEVTENQSMYSLIHTQTRKLTRSLFVFLTHTHTDGVKKSQAFHVCIPHTHSTMLTL